MELNVSTRKTLLLLFGLLQTIAQSNRQKNILILGGNGFLGSHLTNLLIAEPFHLTLLNRGNQYFDSQTTIEPFVHRIIKCDRKTLLRETCKELLEPIVYDVVVDFSSYNDQQIEQVIDILQNKIKIYIFISTDTVYEVRDKKHNDHTREEDTRNKYDLKTEEKVISENQYGYNKLSCEERLIEQRKRLGFPYVIFRLGDAVGERDTTMRWWAYQTLIKLHQHLNTSVPLPNAIKDLRFSMVYAADVANAILEVIEDPGVFHDQIINLAFKEEITLKTLLSQISACLNVTNISYEYDENIAWFRYPSIQRGPIDIKKAEMVFNWSPTSFSEAIRKTCIFFENAVIDERFIKEREIFLAEFIEEILPDNFSDEELFITSMIKIYGPLVFKGIDLGFEVDLDERRIENKQEL